MRNAHLLACWLSILFVGCISCRGQSETSAMPGAPGSRPPAAFLDTPVERSAVHQKSVGTGWALHESGIREVMAALEDGTAARVMTGLPHPGVAEAHPGIGGAANAGFAVQIPEAPAGWHMLTVTIVANDGSKTVITRSFEVR